MTTGTDANDAALLAILSQDIFVGMGLDALPDDERQALLDTILATIKDRVLARVLDELSPELQTELTRLVNTARPDEVSAFLAEHVTDLDALMTQEALRYKVEMVENAARIRQIVGTTDGQPASPPSSTGDDLPAIIPDDLPVPYVEPALPATQDEAPPTL